MPYFSIFYQNWTQNFYMWKILVDYWSSIGLLPSISMTFVVLNHTCSGLMQLRNETKFIYALGLGAPTHCLHMNSLGLLIRWSEWDSQGTSIAQHTAAHSPNLWVRLQVTFQMIVDTFVNQNEIRGLFWTRKSLSSSIANYILLNY